MLFLDKFWQTHRKSVARRVIVARRAIILGSGRGSLSAGA